MPNGRGREGLVSSGFGWSSRLTASAAKAASLYSLVIIVSWSGAVSGIIFVPYLFYMTS